MRSQQAGCPCDLAASSGSRRHNYSRFHDVRSRYPVLSPQSSSSSPTASQIADDADAWLRAASGIFGALCQAAVVGSADCADGAEASELANLALSAFETNPTTANQQNLSTAMSPVYTGAIAANTPSTTAPVAP